MSSPTRSVYLAIYQTDSSTISGLTHTWPSSSNTRKSSPFFMQIGKGAEYSRVLVFPPGRNSVAFSKSFADVGFLSTNLCFAAATAVDKSLDSLICDLTFPSKSAIGDVGGDSALGIFRMRWQKGYGNLF